MPDPGEITPLKPADEIRVCPSCGYTYGFHMSFVHARASNDRPAKDSREAYRVILICPECGARYDPGWHVSCADSDNRIVKSREDQQHSP